MISVQSIFDSNVITEKSILNVDQSIEEFEFETVRQKCAFALKSIETKAKCLVPLSEQVFYAIN